MHLTAVIMAPTVNAIKSTRALHGRSKAHADDEENDLLDGGYHGIDGNSRRIILVGLGDS